MLRRLTLLLFFLSIINAQIALPTFQAVHKPHSTASSTGTVTFTNCGATGKNGPTQDQVNSTYTSGNSLYNAVTINTQGIQEWTVPTSDSFTITVRGASGNRHSTSTTNKFGTGAKMIGTISLNANEVLSILVGQLGSTNLNEWCGAGGGGGSFVVKKSGNTELIVAAGGSGGDGSGHNSEPRPKPGGSSDTGDPTQAGQCNSPYASGAGGGFTYNGEDRYTSVDGAFSFVNGGVGGTCNYGYKVAHGGFGGGGAGDYYTMGGAGGGYEGGSSIGGYNTNYGLTAAKSYNSGSNKTNTDGENETASDSLMHGYVIITW